MTEATITCPSCQVEIKLTDSLAAPLTVDYAERVGHSFARDYSATFSVDVYASLQSLAADTRRSLEALEPKDNIDLQSFIWIVGAYPESDEVAELAG